MLVICLWFLFEKKKLVFVSMVVLRKSKGFVFRENVHSICRGKAEAANKSVLSKHSANQGARPHTSTK